MCSQYNECLMNFAFLSDTHEERDALLERVYPYLQTFSLEHGFDLDVIDLHWGQRDPYLTSENVGTRPHQYLRSLLQEDSNVIIVVSNENDVTIRLRMSLLR